MTEKADKPAKRERIGFWAPASIAVFLALTLVGTYYVRRALLADTMFGAVAIGDEALVASTSNSFPSPVNLRDEAGASPLHAAALSGKTKIIGILLARGAEVRAKDLGGREPLDFAVAGGNVEAVRALTGTTGLKNGDAPSPDLPKWQARGPKESRTCHNDSRVITGVFLSLCPKPLPKNRLYTKCELFLLWHAICYIVIQRVIPCQFLHSVTSVRDNPILNRPPPLFILIRDGG